MTEQPTRILIADDQEMVRTGFRFILNDQPDMEVVGEACDGAEAVEMARDLKPDVLLLDIQMPRMDGIEVTRELSGPDAADPPRIVIVTTFDLDEYVHSALRYGACGFILKRSGPALLIEAVRAAMAGDTLISPSVTVKLLRQLRKPRASTPETGETLTARELEVARLVADGKTNDEVAATLFISVGTVKTHVAHVQRKLNVRNRVGVAAWVWDRDL
jgi:DNA-binding NarL/FixJ family response regulator